MSRGSLPARLQEALRCEADLRLKDAEAAYRRLEKELAESSDWRTRTVVAQGLRRIAQFRSAFSLTETMLHKRMAETFRDYKPSELAEWEKRGLIDFRVIDGEKRYAGSAPFNAAYRDPSLRARYPKMAEQDAKLARFFLDQATAMDQARATSKVPARYVAPLDCVLRMKVTVSQSDLPTGDVVRIWMPAPLLCPSIQDIRVLAVRPEGTLKRLPDLEGEMGVAYLELPRPAKDNLELHLDIAFRAFATDFAVDPETLGDYDKDSDLYQRFTRSEQHIRLTPEVRALAQSIIGGEANPYRKARALYDWVVTHIPYTGIWTWRESIFSPFGSGSQEVMERRCGDCVIQSEFYAALCRSVGVPARVTGGFLFIPEFNNDHFWAEVYLPGLGWMPVDTTMSEGVQLAADLTPAQRKALRDFFFGRLDPYRLPVHRSQVAQELTPEKRSPRRRAAFFTRPELECGDQDVETIKFEWRCEHVMAAADH